MKNIIINDDWYFNLNSPKQLQEFLFEFLQVEPLKEVNDKGNYSVNEEVLLQYANQGIEFCSLLLNYRKLYKAIYTYLSDLIRNIDFKTLILLHPDFWLNTAQTMRSSSSNINFQNIPVHGEIIKGIAWSIIRKLFVSPYGPGFNPIDWLLGEVDYDSAEWKVAGMLGDDPQMIEDINNDFDSHSHWAIEIFELKGMSYEEVKAKYDETYRFLAKNNFTFADIFGAGYQSIAVEFRKSEFYKEYVMGKFKQMNTTMDWDSFYVDYSEKQIQKCQAARKERYPVYTAWQDNVVKNFYETGYVEDAFGFRRRYPLKRNEIINKPIQSTSFLLLLDSIIKIEKELEKDSYFQSRLIGQIHDSGFNRIYKYEACDYIDFVDEIMINKPHLPFTHKVKMGTSWKLGRVWDNLRKIKK